MSINKEEQLNTYRIVSNNVDSKVPEIKPVVLDTTKSVLGNPDITHFKVNNIEIKNL